MDRFLIIRLSSLGDIIHTLPAFSALRKNFRDAEISWIVEEKGKEILELVPGIDKIVPITLKRWRIGSRSFWKDLSAHMREIKNRNQVAIDFQGLVKSGLFAYFSKAEKRIGFHRKNLKEPLAALFYTDRLEEISEDEHVIRKNLKLVSLLGIEEKTYNFPLTLPDELSKSINGILENLGYDGQKKLVLLNVGAAWETKRWYPERWIRLIQELSDKETFLLLLWGNEEEQELAAQICQETGVAMVPPLSLKEVVALVKETSLVVSGDTFALQVACAISKPVVGLFGPTNPKRNGPFGAQDRVAFHELECSYCYKRTCSKLDCLERITPEEVAEMCLASLEKNV